MGHFDIMSDIREPRRAGQGAGEDDPLGTNSEVARKLRQYYSTLVTEDVPDRFAQLLSALESAESSKKKD